MTRNNFEPSPIASYALFHQLRRYKVSVVVVFKLKVYQRIHVMTPDRSLLPPLPQPRVKTWEARKAPGKMDQVRPNCVYGHLLVAVRGWGEFCSQGGVSVCMRRGEIYNDKMSVKDAECHISCKKQHLVVTRRLRHCYTKSVYSKWFNALRKCYEPQKNQCRVYCTMNASKLESALEKFASLDEQRYNSSTKVEKPTPAPLQSRITRSSASFLSQKQVLTKSHQKKIDKKIDKKLTKIDTKIDRKEN